MQDPLERSWVTLRLVHRYWSWGDYTYIPICCHLFHHPCYPWKWKKQKQTELHFVRKELQPHRLRSLEGCQLGTWEALKRKHGSHLEDYIEDAIALLKSETMEREVLVNREYRNGGVDYVSIQRADTKADVSRTLLSQGLMLVDERKEKRLQSLVNEYRTAQDEAKRKHLNVWQYGDVTDDDAHEFGMER